MSRVRLEDVADESDLKDFLLKHDKTYFEKYCGACVHFGTKKCPYLGQVIPETEWDYHTHIVSGINKKCLEFWD